MIHVFFLSAIFVVQVSIAYSQFQDFYYNDNNHMVIGNLRRREVRPLNPFFSPYNRRRYGADAQTYLNYRRTKEIRDKNSDRKFEMSEAQLREDKMNNMDLDNIHNEMRWLALDDDDTIDQQNNNMMLFGHYIERSSIG